MSGFRPSPDLPAVGGLLEEANSVSIVWQVVEELLKGLCGLNTSLSVGA